ncbi:MAG: hypothetical protein JWP01_3293 [Myxococcales bacterium]|nr:hypothetical protein [Myxococcales bacterium]
MATKSSVEQLNSFLRGEISAVETYQMALDKLDHISTARDEVLVCLKSHQDRVMMLTDAIVALGGEPAKSSGPWGVFAKAVEGTAKVLGEKATIAALEEGEDHGMKEYRGDQNELDAQTRSLVTDKLLPMQKHSHAVMSALKHRS